MNDPAPPPTLPLGRITIGMALVAVIGAGVLTGRAVDDVRQGEARVVTIAGRTPLAETLERCRLSGVGGADGPACRAAWAESRDRFFSRPSAETSDE